jgi:hypothetical protein
MLTPHKLTPVVLCYQAAIQPEVRSDGSSKSINRQPSCVYDVFFGEARQLSRSGGLPRIKASEQALLCGYAKTVYFRRLLARIDSACF